MHITFQSDRLRKEFENERVLFKNRGKAQAGKIKVRMMQLEASTVLAQLRNQPGRFHELAGDRKDFMACDLDGQNRLIFAVADNPVPRLPYGGLDWSKVSSVCIHGVVDYH